MNPTEHISFSSLSKTEKYQYLHTTWEHLYDPKCHSIGNLSNAIALIRSIFNHWWVGIYQVVDQSLHLSLFQGDVACTRIEHGKGVCGTSWSTRNTIVVPNVHEFEGHIACSSASNSEIVVPIMLNTGECWGVWDIDSVHFNEFDEEDRKELERFISRLVEQKLFNL